VTTMLTRPLVVVPVDSAEGGETTVSYAIAVAKRRRADVDLLHVVRPRRLSVFESPDLALVGQTSSNHAGIDHRPDAPHHDALVATTDHDDVHVRHVTRQGPPSAAIAAYAQLAMASAIVIGKYYGSSRWRRSTGVASSLSRSTPVPVLIVPPQDAAGGPPKTGPFVNIVSAVDFTVSSAVALRTALDLAQTSGGRVTMVHVLQNVPGRMVFSGHEAFGAIDEVHAEAASAAARLRREIPASATGHVDSRVATGDPHRGILAIAAQVQADLIVMGVPPRGRIDEVLFGSTLRGVLRQATSPVLVLPVVAGAHEWVVGVRP
jgi:nucleotide-binding universal stress UspA family protein